MANLLTCGVRVGQWLFNGSEKESKRAKNDRLKATLAEFKLEQARIDAQERRDAREDAQKRQEKRDNLAIDLFNAKIARELNLSAMKTTNEANKANSAQSLAEVELKSKIELAKLQLELKDKEIKLLELRAAVVAAKL